MQVDTIMVSTNLANSLKDLGRLEEAEELHRDAIARFGKAFGSANRPYMQMVTSLGTVITGQGRHAEAEQLYRTNYDAQRRVMGEAHMDTLMTQMNIANALHRQGTAKHADAREMFFKNLALKEQALGKRHPKRC